jgi:hypothetical protein
VQPEQAAAAQADRIARLRERAEREFPDSWVPEQPGEEIAGELVRYERGTTSYGEQVIAVLRTPDGSERSVWLLHAVLRGEFAKLRPRPGELLLVRYEGKRQPAGGGSAYVSYRVEVDRDDGAPDWDEIGAEAQTESKGAEAPGIHEPLESAHEPADDIPL